MADEELLRDKVYRRVNELMEQSGASRQEALEQVGKELDMKVSTVSANFYRGRAADPSAPPSKRGRPKGSKNKATLEREAAAAGASTAGSSTATATTTRRRATSGTTTRRRSSGTRSRATAAATGSADLNKAVETLNNLVEENRRLTAENRELREQIDRIAKIARI